METKSHNTRTSLFVTVIVLGICLGLAVRCAAQPREENPEAAALAESILWFDIPDEFQNLDVQYLSRVKHWEETEKLLGALATKQLTKATMLLE